MSFNLRVVEHAAVDLAELRLRDLDHVRIELGEVRELERRVLQELFRGAPVAAADHERAPRIGVRRGHRVDEVLVVEELVLLGGHVEAVEPENAAELGRLVDLEQLEGRLATLDERALEVDARALVQLLEDLLGQFGSPKERPPRSAGASRFT